MTVTLPPRATDSDLERRVADLEALIEEARRRARRRRMRNAAAFVVAVGAAVGGLIGFGGGGGGGTGAAALARTPGSQSPAANPSLPSLGALPPGTGTVESFAFDPRNARVVYAMTSGSYGGVLSGGHVLKTIDGGGHWRATATKGWPGFNEALSADPRHPGTLFAGTQHAVYKTINGGRTWRPSHRGLFTPAPADREVGWVKALAVDPENSNVVYAGSDRVNKSSDGGLSWKAVFPPHPTAFAYRVSALAIAPGGPETIYAIAADAVHGRTAIYESTDAGKTWNAAISVRGIEDVGFATSLVVDPQHPTTVYAAIDANVLKTTDGGKTWKSIAYGLPVAFGLSRGGCHCLGGVTKLAVDPRRPTTVYAALLQGGVYKTNDGGRTWASISPGWLYMTTVGVDLARPATIYVAGQGQNGDGPRLLRSTNGGRTWATAP